MIEEAVMYMYAVEIVFLVRTQTNILIMYLSGIFNARNLKCSLPSVSRGVVKEHHFIFMLDEQYRQYRLNSISSFSFPRTSNNYSKYQRKQQAPRNTILAP